VENQREVQPGISPRIKNQASGQVRVNREAPLSRGSSKMWRERDKTRTEEGIERKRYRDQEVSRGRDRNKGPVCRIAPATKFDVF